MSKKNKPKERTVILVLDFIIFFLFLSVEFTPPVKAVYLECQCFHTAAHTHTELCYDCFHILDQFLSAALVCETNTGASQQGGKNNTRAFSGNPLCGNSEPVMKCTECSTPPPPPLPPRPQMNPIVMDMFDALRITPLVLDHKL